MWSLLTICPRYCSALTQRCPGQHRVNKKLILFAKSQLFWLVVATKMFVSYIRENYAKFLMLRFANPQNTRSKCVKNFERNQITYIFF